MKTHNTVNRILEVLGILMIGEGVVGLRFPTRYSLFWRIGPRWMRDAVDMLVKHPGIARLICAGELTAGMLLAFHEIEKE